MKKGGKPSQKSIKKMSCGHQSQRLTEDKPRLKKRPHSMLSVLPSQASPGAKSHLRSNTVSGGKPPRLRSGRRGSRHKSPGSGEPSPSHGADEPRRKKKKDDKRRRQDRAQKHSAIKENLGSASSSLNPSHISVVEAAPLGEEREEDGEHKLDTVSESPARSEFSDISSVDVAASLHAFSLRNSGSFSSNRNRILSSGDVEMRRARSDAHLLNGNHREERHHVCPPERKQFYRQILRRIKSTARHRNEPTQGGVHHISRLRSEDLALGNPFGPMWEQLWQEIQMYLGDMARSEYEQFKYKVGEQIENIVARISRFKVGSTSPAKEEHLLDRTKVDPAKDTIHAVVKRLSFHFADSADSADLSSGRESSGTLMGEGEDASLGGRGRMNSCEARSIANQDDSVERGGVEAAASSSSSITTASATGKALKSRYCFEQFLSPDQLTALDEVDRLLDEMYTLESRYPNRSRLGEGHPHYNDLLFKVRHAALVLWFKVTTSLADKLCTLSVWLEVPVVIPDLCQGGCRGEGHMTIGEAANAVSFELNSPQLSPKSPRVTRGFVLGTSDSGSENTPTSSLNRSHGFPLRCDSIDVTKSLSPLLGQMGGSIDVTKSILSSQLDQNAGPYRSFVNRGLKRKGLTYTVEVRHFIEYTLDSVCIVYRNCSCFTSFVSNTADSLQVYQSSHQAGKVCLRLRPLQGTAGGDLRRVHGRGKKASPSSSQVHGSVSCASRLWRFSGRQPASHQPASHSEEAHQRRPCQLAVRV